MTTEAQRTVVITGASSGIGAAFACQLHAMGYDLLLVARRQQRLEELKAALEKKRPSSVEIYRCDLAQRQETKQLAQLIEKRSVMGLVNNAGVGSLGAFHRLDLETELAQVELNVVAPLILTRAVSPAMCLQRQGFIINVSSIMAYQAAPYVATYAATKAFEWRHSVALRQELVDHGVRVLTLCPGATETEFFGIAKMNKGIWNFRRTPADVVVRTCLKDLESGRLVSIPTLNAKLLVLVAQCVPTFIYTFLVKQVLRRTLPH